MMSDHASDELPMLEAYLTMYAFLSDRWERLPSHALATLLSDMSLLADGGPVDPAIREDWESAIRKVKNHEVDARVRFTGDG